MRALNPLLLAGLLVLLCARSGLAQAINGPETTLPADALLVEAEMMRSQPATAWNAAGYGPFTSWSMYGYPSGLRWLKASEDGPGGLATTSVWIKKSATYRLWIRNLDVPQATFTVTVSQDGKTVARGEYAETTARRPEDSQGWSFGPYLFTWWSLDVPLQSGLCTLTLSRGTPYASGNAHVVDCFAFTSDLQYKPEICDWLPPLFLRVKMGTSRNATSGAVYFGGRIDYQPFFTKYDFINRGGLFHTEGMNGLLKETHLRPGDVTSWMNIAPYLDLRAFNRVRFDLLSGWYTPVPSADFTLELTRTPGEKPLKVFRRAGKGSGIAVLIDLAHPERSYSSIEGSARCLQQARSAPVPPGGKPAVTFPLLTGLIEYDFYDPDQAIRTDLLALRAMGLTGSDAVYDTVWQRKQGFSCTSVTNFTYHLVKEPGCLSQPNVDAMRRELGPVIKQYYTTNLKTLFLRLMDECYSVDFDHLKKCAACTTKFREYLKGKGVQPADFDPDLAAQHREDPWQAIAPTTDKSRRKLYYYTVCFRSQVLTDFFATVTGVVREFQPGLRTAANTSLETTWHRNMLARGVDLFALYRSQALTHGHAEDANSYPPGEQTSTFVMEMLRAACKYHGQPFGTYVIANCPKWDIVAKAAAEVGHGAKFLHFYDYGPYHGASSDPGSQRPDFIPAVKEASYIIGAADRELADAVPAPTKVALVYAHSTDAWTDTADGLFMSNSGTERVDLFLLLRHLGYPVDIITEDDVLEGRVDRYAAIFLTESHLKDGVLPALLAWTRRGGFLYAGAGSARFNQFHEPLTGFEEIGLKRDVFTFRGPSGYWPYDLGIAARVTFAGKAVDAAGGYQRPAEGAGTVLLRFDDGSPCTVDLPCGQGRVVYAGFFPGTSYVRGASIPLLKDQEATRAAGKAYTCLDSTWYQDEYRQVMRMLLAALPYTPPVRISHPLVEGCLLNGPLGDVLMVANWTGQRQTVTVSVDLSYPCGVPRCASQSLRALQRKGNALTFTLAVGAGDAVVFPREK